MTKVNLYNDLCDLPNYIRGQKYLATEHFGIQSIGQRRKHPS